MVCYLGWSLTDGGEIDIDLASSMGATMNRISYTLLSGAVGLLMLLGVTAVLQPNQSKALLAADADADYTIIDLGTLGGAESWASDVNEVGQIVGFSTVANEAGTSAFLWQAGAMVPLSATESMTTYAYAINELGLIAGTAISEGEGITKQWPVLWAGQTVTKLETINGMPGTARAVNNLELVAGNTLSDTDNQLLLWQNESLSQTLPVSGGLGWANGLNDLGQMVGHIDDQGKSLAYLWQNTGFTPLGTLGGTSAKAHDVNNLGQIVGSAAVTGDLATHAFLWEQETMIDLGTLGDAPMATSRANGINDLGIAVGQSQAGQEEHAVLWQDGQILDLNSLLPPDSKWDLLRTAESINEQGWIVGTGLIDGKERAFLLQPVYRSYLPIIMDEEPPPTPTPTPTPSPTPTPVPGEAMDMTRFMIGDGRLYEVQHSNGSQARHQTQVEGKRFFHTKGNEVKAEWEELWTDNGLIYRGTDTSPGSDLYYTLYKDDQPGSPVGSAWNPRYWKVGEIYTRLPYVVFYRKSDCKVVSSGDHLSWLRFERYYPEYTFESGITLKNVVQLAWLLKPNGEPEEWYFYAEDYGLVGWRSQSHGSSYISEIHETGTRPDNSKEVIPCLGTQDKRLRFSSELNSGPLPEPYASMVK